MTKDEAIKKAMKLLRLSKSDNPHEAASAAQKAQEILTRFEINRAMIDLDIDEGPDEEIEDFDNKDAPLDTMRGKQIPTWKIRLSSTVARANQCRIYMQYSGTSKIAIVGRASDVEKVRYLYQYLQRETQRLVIRDGRGCGKTWRNNYRLGVIDAISSALRKAKKTVVCDMRREAKNNNQALVRINSVLEKINQRDVAVVDWMDKNLSLGTATTSNYTTDRGARAQGREAGKEIKINSARGSLASGQRQIKR